MFNPLKIQSYKGEYQVNFSRRVEFDSADEESLLTTHFIVDRKVAEIYKNHLHQILKLSNVLLIEATEKNKSLHQLPNYIEQLVQNKIRRDHTLVAIGGGVIQDITAFLAATLLRGINWYFYPTTLLAQADSCIGSKSSINCGNIKNILGTYTPPKQIFIYTDFLNSLNKVDIQSGIGEMLKVHAIEGATAFDNIAKDYEKIFIDTDMMLHYIYQSLKIKKNIIEEDEFDQHIRNIMNYGHTFGHAIESATHYHIPHGIAVTIGMDMANYIAAEFKFGSKENFHRLHDALKKNYLSFCHFEIPLESFFNAILKDKKNKGKNTLGLILPNFSGKPIRVYFDNDPQFQKTCQNYFERFFYHACA